MNQTLSWCRISLLLAITLGTFQAYAQRTPAKVQEARQKVLSDEHVKAVGISEERGTPSFIQLEHKSYTKAQVPALLQQYLNVRAGIDNLSIEKQTRPTAAIEIVEYQQYFKGIKVEHARFKALVLNGEVRFFNGAWFEVPVSLASQPLLSRTTALGAAKRHVGARKYADEFIQEQIDKSPDGRTRQMLQEELADASPKGELVVVKDFTHSGEVVMKLAYKFDIYAAEPLSRSWVYVDANDGKVLLVDAIIKHASPVPTSVSASVQTRYAGTRNIYVKQISGNDPQSGLPLQSSHPTTELYVPGTQTWVLMDDTRGGGIETYDLNGVGGLPISLGAVYTQGKSLTDVDNNWTLAEHKRGGGQDGAFEAENDDISWDAHWGSEMVYDYWKQRHNRLSYDDKDSKIKSFVHYGPAYDNAFWNGSVMTYGDGSGPAAGGFKALTSLDVCGHEIGHGVCSSTSDLVYASESGAMNEALSDIWAACIEYFAIKTIDPSLAGTYRPFYIGEQISGSPDQPLRRMDNPKAAGNPDTYGGGNWDDPNCTPTLVNDQCGVHNNSGVLNKWFYLLTVGSGAGSGPDASYAGQDDGINDQGNLYSVNGLGFAASENIVYLTELLLTSTATYAEAREVSIAVATELSGSACSPMVETVTNAWYAVGVGEKFVKPCAVTYGFISQGSAVTEANSPAGCTSEKIISIPVLLPANSTASITTGGSATAGQDFVLSASSISNTATSSATKYISVVVKNDAVIEGDESVDFTIAISNAGASPVKTSYRLMLLDDDVEPIIGNTERALLSETFTRADGFEDPAGWTEVLEIPETNGDPTATGKNQWGIFDNKLTITGEDGLTNTKLVNGTYSNVSESRTLVKSPLLDARGLSQLKIQFDYRIQGEVDAQGTDIENFPAFDYMAVAYSLDGVNFIELNSGDFRQFASATPKDGTFVAYLPASLANRQFYIAFRWYNDTNAGGPESVRIDNLTVTGATKKIENDVNQNGREILNAGYEVYFYSTQDGDVLGRVKNSSANNFGCTNIYVEKTGNSSFNLYQDRNGLYKVGDKVVRIEASNLYKASQTITLYYSESQLQALESATGQSRSTFQIYKVSAAAYTLAASNNTKAYPATYTAIPGVGGYYTVALTDKINGSYALGYQVSAKGLEVNQSNMATKLQLTNWKFGKLYPNPGSSTVFVSVSAPQGQRISVEVLSVTGQVVFQQSREISGGVNQLELPLARLGSGSYFIRFKSEAGAVLNAQPYVRQ